MKIKPVLFLAVFIAVGISGFIGGYIYFGNSQNKYPSSKKCQNDFIFINDQLGCNHNPVIKKHEYKELVQELMKYNEELKNQKKASFISIYFRDLNNGPTFGINEREKFAPASLLKVPLLLTYLNKTEDDPSLLQKQIIYTGNKNTLDQNNSSGEKPEENKPYTVEQLLTKMITDSDNLSYQILFNSLKKLYPEENIFTQTMIDFGLVNPRTPTEDVITVKAYASLFRQLFNSSYLSNEMSEKALSILSESKFEKGLVAGIPKNIRVAHKFGERSGLSENEKQLHDCGIIYFPDNPYLLCIMTQGENFEDLEEIIGIISEKVYKEVNSRKL